MPALTKQFPHFITSKFAQLGIEGYLQKLIGGLGISGTGIMGTAVITSGNTSVVITDTGVAATDLFIVGIMIKGTNAVSFVGVSNIVAKTSYTLNVSADPGAAGTTLFVIRLPANLLFSS